jgi:heme A synthase
MAYWILRLVHGYWRWAVLASGAVALVRALRAMFGSTDAGWSRGDERASRWFVATVDVQVMLGLVLYFGFSPFWPAVRDSFRFAIHDRSSRFFGMEHQTAMLLAFVAAHVGRVRIKRTPDARTKQRVLLVSLLVFFTLALWAIPWPWRAVGRPLFRTSW